MIKNRPDVEQDRLQQFYIYLLNDDGTTINDEKYISHTVGDEEAFYFGGSRARHVKILMPYRSTAPYSYLQLAEVEVYELVYGLPMAYCKALLDEFHVPCEKTPCSSRNDQSYQLTIDQVCAAVDSPIKLLTSALAEHVDGVNRLRGPFINGTADDYVADIDIDMSLLSALNTTCCSTPKPDGSCDIENWKNENAEAYKGITYTEGGYTFNRGSEVVTACKGAGFIRNYTNFFDTANKALEEMETEWKEAVDQQSEHSTKCDGISAGKKLSFKYLDLGCSALYHQLLFLTMLYIVNQTKDTCSTFVKYFDLLYEARNVSEFPHRNPMRNWNDRDAAQMGLESPNYMLQTPLSNGGFEAGRSKWDNFVPTNVIGGYTVDTSYKNSGLQSIKVSNNGGAVQYVSSLEVVAGSQVTIKGYSKAFDISTGLSAGDYAIYADVKYLGGTQITVIAPFSGGTHDWQASEKSFTVPAGKTVTQIWLYALYRNDPITSGVAYFDDIEIIVIPPAPREYTDGWKALDNVKFLEGNTFSIDKHGVKLHNGYVIADRVPINDNRIESEGAWTMKNQKKNWIRCSYFKPELLVKREYACNTITDNWDVLKWDFERYQRNCAEDDKLVEGTSAEPEKHAVKCCSSKSNQASFVDQMVSLIDPNYTCPYRAANQYQCPGPKTFQEAVDYCAQLPNGRLCTDEEVYHGCVGPIRMHIKTEPGASFNLGVDVVMDYPLSCDSDLIWTSYSYDYGPVDTGCRATQLDPIQYSQLMQNCDDSMALLLGASTSVGSLVKIVDAITKYGTDRMPGRCCLDDATNSEFIGYNVRMNIPFLRVCSCNH